jgi:hypothetical protein
MAAPAQLDAELVEYSPGRLKNSLQSVNVASNHLLEGGHCFQNRMFRILFHTDVDSHFTNAERVRPFDALALLKTVKAREHVKQQKNAAGNSLKRISMRWGGPSNLSTPSRPFKEAKDKEPHIIEKIM